jgi:hypothetical protein
MKNNDLDTDKEPLLGSQGTIILEENREEYLMYTKQQADLKTWILKRKKKVHQFYFLFNNNKFLKFLQR